MLWELARLAVVPGEGPVALLMLGKVVLAVVRPVRAAQLQTPILLGGVGAANIPRVAERARCHDSEWAGVGVGEDDWSRLEASGAAITDW